MHLDTTARRPRALHRFTIHKLVLAATLFLFAEGCSSDEGEEELGPPTEATCPPASTLTYASFGQAFMSQYCTRCHASTLTGEARMGAPEFHDFDTQAGILVVADHIDELAGAGPAATNEAMPPSNPKPTLEERQQLAEWIACGVP